MPFYVNYMQSISKGVEFQLIIVKNVSGMGEAG